MEKAPIMRPGFGGYLHVPEIEGAKNYKKRPYADRNVHLISNAQIFYERNTESRYDSEARRQYNAGSSNRKLMPPAGVLRSINGSSINDSISPRD